MKSQDFIASFSIVNRVKDKTIVIHHNDTKSKK